MNVNLYNMHGERLKIWSNNVYCKVDVYILTMAKSMFTFERYFFFQRQCHCTCLKWNIILQGLSEKKNCVLAGCIPFFCQKPEFWIPVTRSGSYFVNNYNIIIINPIIQLFSGRGGGCDGLSIILVLVTFSCCMIFLSISLVSTVAVWTLLNCRWNH